MPDPIILDLTGVEVEIRLWRRTANLIEAHVQTLDGNVVNLADKNVTLTIVSRSGGDVKWEYTNEPGDHTDSANGITRFFVPSDATEELEGRRSFTWKYQIVVTDRTTEAQNVWFHGDVRVQPLHAALPALPS